MMDIFYRIIVGLVAAAFFTLISIPFMHDAADDADSGCFLSGIIGIVTGVATAIMMDPIPAPGGGP